jgi:dipeptidyl aminopeptidase/acylaminoacyl peptidase
MDHPAAALPPDGVLDLAALLDARLSPDGRQVAMAVATVQREPLADTSRLWVAATDGDDALVLDDARPLTPAGTFATAPSWAPDGRTLAFRIHDGTGFQPYRVDLDGDPQPVALAALPWGLGGVGPLCAPAGGAVAFSAPVQPPRDPSLPVRVRRTIWRIDGAGLLADIVQELFVLDADASEPRRLTDHGGHVVSAQWSPDGERLLYVCLDLDGELPSWALRRCTVASGEIATLWTSDEFRVYPPAASWLHDGRILRTTANGIGAGEPVCLVVTDGEGRELRRAGEDVDGWLFAILQADHPAFTTHAAPRIVVDPRDGAAYVAVQAGGRGEVWRIDSDTGVATRAVTGDCACVPLDAREGRLLLALSTMHEPPDLWLAEAGEPRPGAAPPASAAPLASAASPAPAAPRRLTALNPQFPAAAAFTVEHLGAIAPDGAPIEGWFLRPAGREGVVPTVLSLHGGPAAAWGHAFSFDHCLFAAAGYGVLLCNPRGSTGYEPDFAQGLRERWGDLEAADVTAMLDHAVAEGLADPQRLSVNGLSAGGYLGAWLITHGDRFQAAMLENPAIDWFTMTAADIGAILVDGWTGIRGGTGLDAATTLARTSATTYAAACTTPTLLIVHERDLRTPPIGTEAFYTLLKLHGCEAELLTLPGTFHNGAIDLGQPGHRVAQNEALLDWLARHATAEAARES